MKIITLFLLVVSTAFAAELPFFNNKNQKVNVSQKDYSSIINRFVQNKIKKRYQPKRTTNLEWIVIGLGNNAGVGTGVFDLSAELAMEFHFRKIDSEEAK